MSKWRIAERTREDSTLPLHTVFHGAELVARDLSYDKAIEYVARACLGNDRIIEEYASGRSATLTGRQLRESLARDKAFDEGRL